MKDKILKLIYVYEHLRNEVEKETKEYKEIKDYQNYLIKFSKLLLIDSFIVELKSILN